MFNSKVVIFTILIVVFVFGLWYCTQHFDEWKRDRWDAKWSMSVSLHSANQTGLSIAKTR